jgi:hypothetical protein
MNRIMSKIRHIQEANQQLEKRMLSESNANKYQINEDIASSFKLGMDTVKDPMVKKVLMGILDCAMVQPLKVVDYLRAVGNLVVLFLGEPADGSDEGYDAYGKDKEERSAQLKKLVNPCKSVTAEELTLVITNKEFQKFFMDMKNKFQ